MKHNFIPGRKEKIINNLKTLLCFITKKKTHYKILSFRNVASLGSQNLQWCNVCCKFISNSPKTKSHSNSITKHQFQCFTMLLFIFRSIFIFIITFNPVRYNADLESLYIKLRKQRRKIDQEKIQCQKILYRIMIQIL